MPPPPPVMKTTFSVNRSLMRAMAFLFPDGGRQCALVAPTKPERRGAVDDEVCSGDGPKTGELSMTMSGLPRRSLLRARPGRRSRAPETRSRRQSRPWRRAGAHSP